MLSTRNCLHTVIKVAECQLLFPGSISPVIGQLIYLTHLNLHSNSLTGKKYKHNIHSKYILTYLLTYIQEV